MEPRRGRPAAEELAAKRAAPVDSLPQEGKIVLATPDRRELAVLRTVYDGNPKNWLLTAYEKTPGRR
jgi:hypothetical protein